MKQVKLITSPTFETLEHNINFWIERSKDITVDKIDFFEPESIEQNLSAFIVYET